MLRFAGEVAGPVILSASSDDASARSRGQAMPHKDSVMLQGRSDAESAWRVCLRVKGVTARPTGRWFASAW